VKPPRPAPGTRRTLRPLAALVLAAATLLALATGAGPAHAQAGTTITLEDQVTWLRPGEPFTADVRVARAPAGATVQVVAHEALGSRAQFEESVGGDPGRTVHRTDPQPLAAVTGADGLARVGFGPEADLNQGVHPVVVQVLAGADVVAELVTYVVVPITEAEGFTPLNVAVVLDVAAPTALQPDGTVLVPDTTVDRVTERAEALAAAPKAPVTVAPRPETIDSLAVSGESGDELVARLDRAIGDRTVLARPYTDVDVAQLGEAGLLGEVNAQADAGADVLRQRFGIEPTPGIWLVPGTVGAEAARTLNDIGVGQAVVGPSAVAEAPRLGDGLVPDVPIRFGEGGPEAVVADEALVAHLDQEGALGAQRFVAALAMTWFEAPANDRAVAARVPASADIDPEALARALDELEAEPSVLRPVSLPDLFAAVQPPEGESRPVAEVADHQGGDDLRALAPRLEAARESVGGIGGILGDDEQGRSLEHSLLLATGADTPDDRRDAYVDRVTTELSLLDDLVTAPNEFRITLTSRTATIPLNLTNNAARPVDVRIELQSDQLEFPEGDVLTETLPPGPSRIDVPVRVLASGAFPLDITITSPDRSIELVQTRYDIRSTVVSGVGLVLSIGAGLFLALWWVKNWRATARSKALVPPPADEGGDDDLPPPPGPPPAPTGAAAPRAPAHLPPPPSVAGAGARHLAPPAPAHRRHAGGTRSP
jgi:hypothetical protein